MKYEDAIKKLETIAGELERNELPIDLIAGRLREAQQLVAFCREQLMAVDKEIGNIMSEGSAG